MLYQKISDDIKNAMRSKEEVRLSVLRMIKSKIMAVNARGDMPDDDIVKIIKTYHNNLKDALALTQNGGRVDEASELEKEMSIVSEFIPVELTIDQITAIVSEIIQQKGFTAKSEFGKVMKELMANHKNIDGSAAKNIINKLLV